ncbi:DUF4252 domain-containing protein [Salegentibacter chungangensis]|uniref:DUF4252 domain-containing protein n=1 Tax=Salegentibacter chungangensis TaxID=1335724 RepID=A0ABW3NSF8_9FLAO
MKSFKILILAIAAVSFAACNNDPSLQEYYVSNQEDSKFIAIDMPTSMFANADSLDEEHRATLESVKKVNVLAFPLEQGKEALEAEKAELQNILKNDKYQLLMKYGSNGKKAEVYFTGKEDAIDELIVFGYDDTRGVGVARVLGEDMDPAKIMKLIRSLEEGDLNVKGIKGIAGMINSKVNDDKASEDPEKKEIEIETEEEGK